MEALPTIDPLAGTPGETWVRKVGGGAFSKLEPLPPARGRGFALAPGLYDIAVVPADGCSVILPSVKVELDASVPPVSPKVVRPAAIRARFVTTRATPVLSTPVLSVVNAEPSVEAAWNALYRSAPIDQLKDGTLTIRPIPCDGYSVGVAFPRSHPVQMRTNRAVRGILELDPVVVPELVPLTVQVEASLDALPGTSKLALHGSLEGVMDGVPQPTLAATKQVELNGEPGRPFTTQLFPGDWRLQVRVDGRTVGERVVRAMEGDSLNETFEISRLRVSGEVLDSSGGPAPGVKVDALYVSDGQRPAASVETDDKGSFSLLLPHAGGAIDIVASPPLGGHRIQRVDPAVDDLAHLRIRLGAGVVRVVAKDVVTGKVVPQIPVVLRHRPRPSSLKSGDLPSRAVDMYPRGTTDTNGVATFSQLDDGEVSIQWVGNDEWIADTRTFWMPSDLTVDKPQRETVVLGRPAKKVTIDLTSTLGASMEGAQVIGPFSASMDQPRTFAADPQGHCQLVIGVGEGGLFGALANGYRLRFFTVEPNQETLRVDLSPRRAVSAVQASLAQGTGRIALGLAVQGVEIPGRPLSYALRAGGCSPMLAPPSLEEPSFGACLDDGV